MNVGISFLIHNKETYEKNKKKIIKAIEKKNADLDYIFDASVIEFRGDFYLIIDGHTAFMGDEKFTDKLSKMICPAFEEDPKKLKQLTAKVDLSEAICDLIEIKMNRMREDFEGAELEVFNKISKRLKTPSYDEVKREHLFEGQFYGEDTPMIYKFFGIESEKEILSTLQEDIFKATTDKVSVGEVVFVETLYQLDIEI